MNPSEDVQKYHALLGQPVRIQLKKGCNTSELFGNIYTIDPVEGHVVVIQFENAQIVGVHWVQPQAVVEISIVDPASVSNCLPGTPEVLAGFHDLFKNFERPQLDESCAARRKIVVMEYLRSNNIQVDEKNDGSLLIFETVIVESPYTAETCLCDNAIVLQRVRNMISKIVVVDS